MNRLLISVSCLVMAIVLLILCIIWSADGVRGSIWLISMIGLGLLLVGMLTLRGKRRTRL